MIAVDTNVLVQAFRGDAPQHEAAARSVGALAAGTARWAVPYPCVHEFLAVVTHPRIWADPAPPAAGLAFLRVLSDTPSLRLLSETPDHLTILDDLLDGAAVRGPKVHDARIAAICLGHGVRELWSADRDFAAFPQLRTRNPLLAGGDTV